MIAIHRYQKSNSRSTDYKEGTFNFYISGLKIFLLRANALKAKAYARSMAVITWVKIDESRRAVTADFSCRDPANPDYQPEDAPH